ncbi:MAG: Ig family protein, partial [Verrucomicrobiales bacterium]|nr:Ig family protein [Verrucomicrobiales bacterium]
MDCADFRHMTQSDSKVRVSEICGVVSTHSLLKSLLAFTLLGSNLFPPPVVAACVALPEIAANNAVVKILYPLPNGEVIVAGSFAEIAGKSQTNLARLTAAGDLDESFRPVTSDAIQFLVPDKQGRVIVSQGEGTELIAFRPDGSLDPTYKTEGRSYSSLAVDSQNRVLAFISQGESGFILRLLGNGRRDPDFNIVSSTNEDLSSFVLLPNDEIVFTLYDAEQFKTTIYKSDQNGRVVAGFRSWSLTGLHRLIGRRGTELLYLADSRDTPFSVGEFGIDGTLLREFSWPSRSVAAFAADPNGIPYFLAKDEGKIASFDKVIGIPLSSAFGVLSSNHFLLFSNQPQLGATIFRINSTGEVEQKIQVFQSGSPYVNSRPSAIGGLLLVGSFERVAQVDRFHLARLQSDFSLDHSFNPDKIATNFLQIGTFEFLDGGVGLVDASQVATNPVGNRILRLLPAGELDAAYLTPPAVVATNLNGQPLLLTLPNNEIIFAGSATSTVSNPLNSLVHLGQSGQLVSTVPVFDPWAAPGARFSGLAKYGANQFLVGLYISNA